MNKPMARVYRTIVLPKTNQFLQIGTIRGPVVEKKFSPKSATSIVTCLDSSSSHTKQLVLTR